VALEHKSRDEHLFGPGPKRILTLDGGGILGVISLAYLERLEELLRKRYGGDPEFRLSDYFDLIGGTSTGSIIASALALGYSVNRLIDLYRTLGGRVFRRSFWRLNFLEPRFSASALRRELARELGDVRLGGDELKTGLVVVAKRLDSASPWVMHNNPRGRFYEAPEDDPTASPNKDFLLQNVVRASAAAPLYFRPERIGIAEGVGGAFVDGGVSPFNNPALLITMMATMDAYGFGWEPGGDKLLVVSVGTGFRPPVLGTDAVMKMSAPWLALRSLTSLMADCDILSQTVLQWLSKSPTPWPIDSEVGDLSKEALGGRAWLSYLRYNAVIESEWLRSHLGMEVSDQEAKKLYALDRPENIERLMEIAGVGAKVQVDPAHFEATFDLAGA
jgi:predicted acylesterase/phospholipase RssA